METYTFYGEHTNVEKMYADTLLTTKTSMYLDLTFLPPKLDVTVYEMYIDELFDTHKKYIMDGNSIHTPTTFYRVHYHGVEFDDGFKQILDEYDALSYSYEDNVIIMDVPINNNYLL